MGSQHREKSAAPNVFFQSTSGWKRFKKAFVTSPVKYSKSEYRIDQMVERAPVLAEAAQGSNQIFIL